MFYLDDASTENFHKYRAWGFSIRCIEAVDGESSLLFSRTYGGIDNERAWALDQASDGGFVIAGMTESYGAGYDDVLLLKLDTIGNLEMGKAYDAASGEECYSVKVTTDNGYILTGESGNDVYNLRLDSFGNVVWDEKTAYGGYEQNRDVIQDQDGGFVFAGYTDGFGAGGYDILVTKRDAAGGNVWGWGIGNTGDDYGHAIIKDTDGGYATAGYSNSNSNGGYDVLFQKLDAGGNWQSGWSMGGTENDYSRDLSLSHDSGYVMVGYTYSYGAGGADFYIRQIDADGVPGWGSVMGGAEEDFAFSVALTEDNGFAIAGQTRSFGAGSGDVWFVKLDSNGNFEWSWVFGGPDHESGESIIIGEDGCYYIAGYTRSYGVGGGTDDALLVKFAPDGGTCLGYYTGLPADSDNISFKSDDSFIATPINEVFFQRISGDEKPAKMKIMRIPAPENANRDVFTTITPITPTITTICEDEW